MSALQSFTVVCGWPHCSKTRRRLPWGQCRSSLVPRETPDAAASPYTMSSTVLQQTQLTALNTTIPVTLSQSPPVHLLTSPPTLRTSSEEPVQRSERPIPTHHTATLHLSRHPSTTTVGRRPHFKHLNLGFRLFLLSPACPKHSSQPRCRLPLEDFQPTPIQFSTAARRKNGQWEPDTPIALTVFLPLRARKGHWTRVDQKRDRVAERRAPRCRN